MLKGQSALIDLRWMWITLGLSNLLPSLIFERASFPFTNVFHGLFTRWICEMKSSRFWEMFYVVCQMTDYLLLLSFTPSFFKKKKKLIKKQFNSLLFTSYINRVEIFQPPDHIYRFQLHFKIPASCPLKLFTIYILLKILLDFSISCVYL